MRNQTQKDLAEMGQSAIFEKGLICLLNPRGFSESAIQRALEFFWDYLFSGYRMMERARVVDENWRPDLVAYNESMDYWLIIELKGSPPANSRQKTVDQILNYAFYFQEKYPDAKAKLLIIGPWETERIEKDNCTIGVMKLETIGQWLAIEAAHMMKWFMESPSGTISYCGLENLIEKHIPIIPLFEELV